MKNNKSESSNQDRLEKVQEKKERILRESESYNNELGRVRSEFQEALANGTRTDALKKAISELKGDISSAEESIAAISKEEETLIEKVKEELRSKQAQLREKAVKEATEMAINIKKLEADVRKAKEELQNFSTLRAEEITIYSKKIGEDGGGLLEALETGNFIRDTAYRNASGI